MTTDLYSYVRGYSRAMTTLQHILRKGAEHAAASGVPESEMLRWRLAPDMFDLRQQAITVVQFTQQWLARAADLPQPAPIEGEPDLAEILARAAEAQAFIDGLTPAQFEGRDDVPLTFNLGQVEPTLPVGQWIAGFATTNVWFHLSMAYAILRNRGVPLGKRDLFAGGL
ncbi:DUF1993 domain-containing protein [Phenylobacterium sp.]|uniref:DUF1993 domain-containing protein n=1 Tax=Phenylobacterium sp. TaxID=1871053 RepID=UPI002FDFBF21